MKARFFSMIAMATVALASLTSCQEDNPLGSNKNISFRVVCSGTRAAASTTESLKAAGSFNVVAFSDADKTSYFGETITANYVETDGDSYWKTDRDWPSDGAAKLNFWSFAPAGEIEPSFSEDRTEMTFTYPPVNDLSARMDAKNQKDLLVAYTGGRNANNAGGKTRVPVTFNHALSAIQFKVGQIDPWYGAHGITEFQISSIILNNFAKNGTCTVTKTGEVDDRGTGYTIAGSNMSIAWTPSTETTSYQNFYEAKFSLPSNGDPVDRYLDQIDNANGSSNSDGIFMIVPQTLGNNASISLNWGAWETVENTLGGTTEYQYVQRPTRTTTLGKDKDGNPITFEPGYKYVFTININHKSDPGTDPDNPQDEKDIYVILTEKIPWVYVEETKEYADIATGYPKIEFSNVQYTNTTTNEVFVYPYPQELVCSVKLANPKGAKLLIKIEQEFDAFDYEFITSDQIPDDGTQTDLSTITPIQFKLKPRYTNPEREYVATLSLSLRLVNGRIVNIDDQVQPAGKFKIVLQKAN